MTTRTNEQLALLVANCPFVLNPSERPATYPHNLACQPRNTNEEKALRQANEAECLLIKRVGHVEADRLITEAARNR